MMIMLLMVIDCVVFVLYSVLSVGSVPGFIEFFGGSFEKILLFQALKTSLCHCIFLCFFVCVCVLERERDS